MDEHHALFEEADREYLIFGVGMFMSASHGRPDAVQTMIDTIKIFDPPLAERAVEFAAKLPKEIAFADARQFIRQIRELPVEPQSTDPEQWLALAEFLYWIQALKVKPGGPVRIDLTALIEFPSLVSSKCYLAAHLVGGFKEEQEGANLQETLLWKFVEEYGILSLVRDSEIVTVDYILPEEVSTGFGSAGLSESLLRIEILRCLLPTHSRIHVRGKNQLRLFDVDDSDRNLDSSDVEYPWQRRWSRTLANFVRYRDRPGDWPSYVEALLAKCDAVARGIRWTLAAACKQLSGQLTIPFNSPLEECVKVLQADLLLPKTAVDPFGRTLLSDGSRLSSDPSDFVSLGNHRNFEKVSGKYFSEVSTYFHNANLALLSAVATARQKKAAKEAFEKFVPANKIEFASRGIREIVGAHREFVSALQSHFGQMIGEPAGRLPTQAELDDTRDVWQLLALQPHTRLRSVTDVVPAARRLVADWLKKRQRDFPAGSLEPATLATASGGGG